MSVQYKTTKFFRNRARYERYVRAVRYLTRKWLPVPLGQYRTPSSQMAPLFGVELFYASWGWRNAPYISTKGIK